MVKNKKMKVRVQVQPSRKKSKSVKERELTRLGSALRTLGGLGGGALGALVGHPGTGSSVGTSLGAALSRWLGSGDYTVSANSIVQRASTGIPMMHKTEQKIVVRHKEFLGEVRSSRSFNVRRSFPLNPGMHETFPWLSQIARNFQTYSFKGVVFHYIPTSGNAISSTNNALGSVMFQTSYRANDAPPSSKVEMMNEYWSCEVVPSDTVAHPIECAPKENPFQVQYVRSGTVPPGDNQLLYDLGVTHVAVSGMQDASDDIVLGDIWVSYEVELSKPIISSNVVSRGYYAEYTSTATAPILPLAIFGPGKTLTTIGNVQLELSANNVTIPRGVVGALRLFVSLKGTFNAVNMTGGPTVTNGSVTPLMQSPGPNRYEINATTTNDRVVYACEVTKTDISKSTVIDLPNVTFAAGSTIDQVTLLCVGFPYEL